MWLHRLSVHDNKTWNLELYDTINPLLGFYLELNGVSYVIMGWGWEHLKGKFDVFRKL